MHLAQTDEWKEKFELFYTHPEDKELKQYLDRAVTALMGEDNISHSLQDKHGWAFFPVDDGSDLSEEERYMQGVPDPLHPSVKEYIKERLESLFNHEVVHRGYETSVWQELHEGMERHENVEVDCFYFYDNPSWYE